MGKVEQENEASNTYEESGITFIETLEDMDLYSALMIKEQFNYLIEHGKSSFIIDLVNTKYIDSSGLGVLIHIQTTAMKKKGISIRFINMAPTVLKIMQLTHLDKMFKIVDNKDDAIDQINGEQMDLSVSASLDDDSLAANSTNETTSPSRQESKAANSPKRRDDKTQEQVREDVDFTETRDQMDRELLQTDDELPEELVIPEEDIAEQELKQLLINNEHKLFKRTGLRHKTFRIKIDKIPNVVSVIMQRARVPEHEAAALKRQIYELLKNAVKHGNKNNRWKAVKVWFNLNHEYAHLIIEDSGKGFQEIEEWNEFYRQRTFAYQDKTRQQLKKYQAFQTAKSDGSDRGTALFSSIEFWNEGIIFQSKRNILAVKRVFE